MLELNDYWSPSPANRGRFAVNLLGAGALCATAVWFSGGRLFPYAEIVALLASLVGIRNAQSLVSPPYLRLDRDGIRVRYWPTSHSIRRSLPLVDRVTSVARRLSQRVLPLRRYRTLSIPWNRYVSAMAYDFQAFGLFTFRQLDLDYSLDDGTSEVIVISQAMFSRTPDAIASAIENYRDFEFRWKPLRSSGLLDRWVQLQKERFREPMTIRYRRNVEKLSVGAGSFGIALLTLIVIVGLVKLNVNDRNVLRTLGKVIGFCGLLGIIPALEEITTWMANWNRHRLILKENGLWIGHSEKSGQLYPWSEVVSAQLGNVGGFLFQATTGLEIMLSDRKTISLPSKYNRDLSQVAPMVTPSEFISGIEERDSSGLDIHVGVGNQ